MKAEDPEGRMRPLNRELWLREAKKRLKTHTNRCMACLRFEAGLTVQARCGVRNQIQGQIEVLETAIARDAQCASSS